MPRQDNLPKNNCLLQSLYNIWSKKILLVPLTSSFLLTFGPHQWWKYPESLCLCCKGYVVCTCSLVKSHRSMPDVRQQTGMCPGSHSKPFLPVCIKTPQGPAVCSDSWMKRGVCVHVNAKSGTHSYFVLPQHHGSCPLESRAALCQTDYIFRHLVPWGSKGLCRGDCCYEWLEGSVNLTNALSWCIAVVFPTTQIAG